MRRRGFTLIELLVVIAIIALLISILLPSLGRARKGAFMAISLSNIRQHCVAAADYQQNNKGYMPITMCSLTRGMTGAGKDGGAWATFSHMGKNAARSFVEDKMVSTFDIEAADRPLNPYLYPEMGSWGAPDPPAQLAADSSARFIEGKVFKDPSDKIGHQQKWPKRNPNGLSAYDEIGTSYMWSAKWWWQVDGKFGGGQPGFTKAFNFGMQRMRIADSFVPSRFVWQYDETSDLVVNIALKTYQFKNGYDDINKSLLGFMDGHGAYLTVYPGIAEGDLRPAFTNDKYTFIFEDLKIPG